MLVQLCLVDARAGENALPHFAVEVSKGGELDKVSIARCVLRKNNQMITLRGLVRLGVLWRLSIESVVDNVHLVANDRLDVCVGASSNELNSTVEYAMVGESQCGDTELRRAVNERGQLTGAVQKREVGMDVKWDVLVRRVLDVGIGGFQACTRNGPCAQRAQ